MTDRMQRIGRVIARGFVTVGASAAILWAAPLPLAAQGSHDSITVIYGDGRKLPVRDWNFAYTFLDGESKEDLYCYEDPCGATKTSQDLHLVNSYTGPTPPVQEFAIFWKENLRAIRIHWKTNNLGPYESDGVTLNRNRTAPLYEREGITVVTTRGTEYDFPRRLFAPDRFLSNKTYVRLRNIWLRGRVRGPRIPDIYELPLSGRLAVSSLKERIDEIRFPKY